MKIYIKKIIGIIFVLSFLYCNNVYSMKIENINFQNLTIEDGLSQSLVEYIYQDSLGYIWIGTNDGLNRYNGNEFKVYKNIKNDPSSISNSAISSIVEDDNRNLWVSTYSGLNKINLLTGEITRYLNSEEDISISNNIIDEVVIDSKGRLWVCTSDGLNIYDEDNDKFNRVLDDKFRNLYIQAIAEDYKNRIWIATINGLYMYDEDKGEVKEFFNDPNDKNTISENNVFSIHASGKELLIGTKNTGLNIMNLEDFTVKRYSHDSNDNTSIPGNLVRDILKDKQGNIWVATDQGLASFDKKDETFYTYKSNSNKHSINDDNIISIFEDRLGTIWVGTFSGVSKFSYNNNFKIYRSDTTNDNTISNSSVCGIYEDDDGFVWVGTFNSGINKIDEKNNIITRYYNILNNENSLSSNRIKDITGIKDEIWIATDNGLNKFNKNTGEFTVYKKSDGLVSDEIRVLHIDSDGLLWIGTRDGISTFDRKNQFLSYNSILEENNISDKIVSSIYEDKDGVMWFGLSSDGGLIKFDKRTGEVKRYISDDTNEKAISSSTVRSISEDSKGNLWIGTQIGLNKFNKETEEFISYTYKDGLSNDYIYGVLIDDFDNVWVSTNYGISMYDAKDEKFIRYYEADGLATNEFNGFSYTRGKSGNLYFGGVNGLTKFNPNDIVHKINASNVIIDTVKTSGGIEINKKDNIVLNYDSRELYIKFFIPEYKNINQIQYVYKLDGIDNEWVFAGNENYARYASLKPGKYKLLIGARNYNGVWSDISEVNIKVKNYPWKTPTAYFIYLIVISIIVYLLYNEVKILDKLVVQRTCQLNNELNENKKLYKKLIEAEKYKNNYFINLSHELRTPLNVILSIEQLISSLMKSGTEIEDEKMESYMSSLRGNSKRLLNLINNIIDTSKIESGSYRLDKETVNIVEVVEDTALSMVELAKAKQLELIIDPEIEELYISCDKLDIERCIINLIGNAIKFTEPGGRINVSISIMMESAKITVKDTGIGIEEKYYNSIFDRFGQVYNEVSEEFGGSGLGLTLTKNIINLHGGDISVISEKGKGSEFIIILPIN